MQQAIFIKTRNNLLGSTENIPFLSICRKRSDCFDRFLIMRVNFFGKDLIFKLTDIQRLMNFKQDKYGHYSVQDKQSHT